MLKKKTTLVNIHPRIEEKTLKALRKLAFDMRITVSLLVRLILVRFIIEGPGIDLTKKK